MRPPATRRLRRTLALYGVGALLTLAALAALTAHVVRGEHAQHRAEALATFHEDLRLALWRMESRVGPLLARALAQAEDHLVVSPPAGPEPAQGPARQVLVQPFEAGDPVLLEELEVPGEPGDPTSEPGPRPTYDQNFLLNAETGANDAVQPWDEALDTDLRVAAWRAFEVEGGAPLDPGAAARGGADAPRSTAPDPGDAPRQTQQVAEGDLSAWVARAGDRSQREWSNRKATLRDNSALNGMAPVQSTVQVLEPAGAVPRLEPAFRAGPLVARWEPRGAPEFLLLARAVRAVDREATQVFGLPWPELERTLRAEVEDLFPDARLVPLDPEAPADDDGSDRLAAIPARLAVPPPDLRPRLGGRTRAVLLGAWALALVALGAVGFALRAGVAHGERHRRFTSAVTHELRTPLTTFQLYSEMLARGMVPEEARAEYLATLESESRRLGALVQNVLDHARLEEGRAAPRRVRIGAGELLDRVRPPLARLCEHAGQALWIPPDPPEVELDTDPETVLGILANLVDNACKYGRGPQGVVRLEARREGARLQLRVRDEGPGVPAGERRRLFDPFERCGRDERDPSPGVGLGLALARGQARALGGDLRCLPDDGPGACFELTLPLA